MEYIVNAHEMRQYDLNTTVEFAVPSIVLMERAALAAAEEIEKWLPPGGRVLAAAGVGNNGGDGLAAARLLWQRGYDVTCVLIGDREKMSEQTALQMQILQKYGLEIGCNLPDEKYNIIIDALFGIGLTRDVKEEFAEAIAYINERRGSARVVSLDIPSGINADTGRVMGTAVKAHSTVTFAFQKRGLLLYPGADYAGNIVCRDIGITKESFLGKAPSCFTYGKKDLERLPVRPAYGNKGTFGKVLLIAGSEGMGGACLMAGESIYRMGAGLVRIMTVKENRSLIQEKLPEAVLVTYNAKQCPKKKLAESLTWADCIAIGPGISQSKTAEAIVRMVLEHEKPLIIDADAINLIAADNTLRQRLKERENVVMTPHIGEFARLSGETPEKIKENLIEAAHVFAKEYHITLVCKDARTVVCNEKETVYLNTSGNAGMATAGSGDVLTGIVTGLAAQKMNLYDAAVLGVYIHGLAGDIAAERYNESYMLAGTLIEQLQFILKKERIE